MPVLVPCVLSGLPPDCFCLLCIPAMIAAAMPALFPRTATTACDAAPTCCLPWSPCCVLPTAFPSHSSHCRHFCPACCLAPVASPVRVTVLPVIHFMWGSRFCTCNQFPAPVFASKLSQSPKVAGAHPRVRSCAGKCRLCHAGICPNSDCSIASFAQKFCQRMG